MGEIMAKICPTCGNQNLIDVSVYNGIYFLSCNNEECEMYAQLVVNINDSGMEPEYRSYADIMDVFISVVVVGLTVKL